MVNFGHKIHYCHRRVWVIILQLDLIKLFLVQLEDLELYNLSLAMNVLHYVLQVIIVQKKLLLQHKILAHLEDSVM